MRDIRSWARYASVALAALLASCGGSDGADTAPAASITSVKVMGDSLADSGTFGIKFTVQATNASGIDLATPRIYPELVANTYGVALCNAYTATSQTTFIANPTKTGCTNYAIGGGRINNYSAPTSPLSIPVQLAAGSAAGNYAAGDLLIVDGGGNDAADLIGAYLQASTNPTPYITLLGTVLPPATVNAALAAGATGLAGVGATYLSALADNFYASIKASALDKGAQRVVVLNMPGITNTPRFQMVLDGIAAASGGGTAGATARAQFEALFKSWIVAFNTELAAKFAGNANVIVVDFYTSFNDQVAAPAQFGLQNATTPACPITGVGSDGLPTYTFAFAPAVKPSALLAQELASGIANMPVYQSSDYYRSHSPAQLFADLGSLPLNDLQRWDLVAAIWQSNTTLASLAQGKTLFTQNCAACHGEKGAGNGVFAGKLSAAGTASASQPGNGNTSQSMTGARDMVMQTPANFSDPARMLCASPTLLQGKILRGGMGTGMPMWGNIFTDEQIWNVIAYLYSFQFDYSK